MKNSFVSELNRNAMTLIMSLPANDPDLAKVAWDSGADVMKVHINVTHRASKTQFHSLSQEQEHLQEILTNARGCCGFVGGDSVEAAVNDYQQAAQMGFSFISLYAHHMAPQILQFDMLTKMVALSHDYNMEQVRCLESIGGQVLEASIMDPATYGQLLSAHELMQYASICKNTNLPVVVPTQRMILPQDIPSLYRCGVRSIMIGAVVTGKTADSIARSVTQFRNAIDQLPK